MNLVLWQIIEVPEPRALDRSGRPFLFCIWGLQLLGVRERKRSLGLKVLNLLFCWWWKGSLCLVGYLLLVQQRSWRICKIRPYRSLTGLCWLLFWMILVEIWLDKVDWSPLTVDHKLFEHTDYQFFFLAVELLLALVLRNVRGEKLGIQLLQSLLQIQIFWSRQRLLICWLELISRALKIARLTDLHAAGTFH